LLSALWWLVPYDLLLLFMGLRLCSAWGSVVSALLVIILTLLFLAG
jgi:hypothetical protein